MYTPVHPSFTIQKWGVRGYSLRRLAFVMSCESAQSDQSLSCLQSICQIAGFVTVCRLISYSDMHDQDLICITFYGPFEVKKMRACRV